jgi:ketosteroid isomerase-like protein
MDQDNSAVVRKMYTAFGQGDLQTLLDSVTETTEWINHGPSSIPYAGKYRGRAEIRRFFEAIASSTNGGKVTANTYMTSGDVVAVLGRYSATVKDNGAPIDVPIAHFFTVQNGKVTRWEGFSDSAAVAAAHTSRAAAHP